MTGRRLARPSSGVGGPAVAGALPQAGATPAAPPSPAPGPLPEGSAPVSPAAGGRRRNDDDDDDDEDGGTRADLLWVPIPAGAPPRAMDVPLIRPPGLSPTPEARTPQDLTVASADAPHSTEFTVLHGLLRSVQVDPDTGELRIVDNRTGDTVLAVAPPIGRDVNGREVPSEFTVAPNGNGTSTLTQTLNADPQTVSYPLTALPASGGLSPQWAAAAAILGYRFKGLNPARLGEFVLQAGEQILPVSGVRNLAALTADEVARGTAHPPGTRDPKVTPDAKDKWLQEKAAASRPILERAQLTDPNLFRRLAEVAGLDPDAPGTTVTRVASRLAEAEWGRNSLVPTHAPDRAFSGRDVIDTATSPLRTSPLRSSIANLLPDLRPEQVPIVGPLDDILAERSGVPLTGESRTNSTLGGSAKHQSPNVSAVRQLAQDMVNSGRGAETLDGKISTLVQRPDGTATLIGPDSPEAQRAAANAGVKITEHATDTANPPKPYNPGRTPTVTTPAPAAASAAEAVRPTVAGRAAPVLRGLGKASPLLFPAAVVLDVNQGKTAGQAIVTNGTSAVLGGGASYALLLAGASGFPVLLVGVGVGVVGYEVGNYVWNDVLSQSQRDAISNTISKADWGPVDPATTKAGWSTNGYPGSAATPRPQSVAPVLPQTAIPLQVGPNGQVIPQMSAPTAPIVTRGPDINSSQTRSGNDTTADRTQSPNGRVDPQGPTASINKPGSIYARRSGNDMGAARAEAAARARAQEQAAAAQAAPSRPPIAPSTDPEGRSKPASGKAADLDEM